MFYLLFCSHYFSAFGRILLQEFLIISVVCSVFIWMFLGKGTDCVVVLTVGFRKGECPNLVVVLLVVLHYP